MWNSMLGAAPAQPPDPVLTPTQVGGKVSSANFEDHFFFNGRSDFNEYDTVFNPGAATITGIINAPSTGVFNPAGYADAAIFQPLAERVETIMNLGTRGWLSDRVDTNFTVLQEQDLTTVNLGAPAQNIIETFPGNREYLLLNASIDIHGKPGDGFWSGFDLGLGRMNVYGAELASFDGLSMTLDRPRFTIQIYGGRRFSYYSDPVQRAIGGLNFTFKLTPDSSLEYDGLIYVRATHAITYRTRFGASWMWSTGYRMVGGAPVDFHSDVIWSPGGGKTTIRAGFFQKLTNNDYFYDYTDLARYRINNNYLLGNGLTSQAYADNGLQTTSLLGLNLGPEQQYSQATIEAHRAIVERWRLGASVIVRRLDDNKTQGPFDTSFQDYRVNSQVYPLRKTEIFMEYHQRDSDRLSPLNSTTLSDINYSGETSVKDLEADVRQSFGNGRFGLSGGVYYRRISLQDQFYILSGLHQSGWLAGAWWKVDTHTRVFIDYDLDNDFFLFTPDLKYSRSLHAGIAWKY
jgi:hypothetical protein